MDLDACLAASRATAAFVADVRAYCANREAPRIVAVRPSPRIKILRVVTHLLHVEPTLAIDRVRIDAVSGCADYRGLITATVVGEASDADHAFDFVWDCSWRAAHEGWLDRYGLPDQQRAAREFAWQCFAAWAPRPDAAVASAAVASHR